MRQIRSFVIVSLLMTLFSAAPVAADMTGVWLATVSVNKVVDVNNQAAGATSTSTEFPLRLLLHVDAGGTVRLLKEMIAMTDSATNKVVAVADSSLASGYTGVVSRGDTKVGLRTSAIGYDFKGSTKDCTGIPGSSGTVACTVPLLSDDPTNPFLHRYHPDHDNLSDDYSTTVTEAYAITRTMTLTFSSRYPANPDLPALPATSNPLGWGATELGGTYSETIAGLHKSNLSVSGWFTMKRIAAIADLKK